MQVKTSFSKEDYLNIKDFKLRQALARLRMSAQNLAIERGRYKHPTTNPSRLKGVHNPS